MKRVLALAVVLVLLAWPAAGAEYRGSDLFGNVSPQSQVNGGSSTNTRSPPTRWTTTSTSASPTPRASRR